ncbi:MAG: Holliday junction resolvase RuvX [Crocinitomicaceae bacterium]
MAKIIAVDYGSKRTGLAVTDDLQIIASGLTTVATQDLFTYLKDFFEKNEVEAIVLGEPKRLDGSDTHSSVDVRKLKEKLGTTFAVPIHMIDERFTSKMAFQTMIDSGLSKKQRRNKALVDEISATIILQSYLETK